MRQLIDLAVYLEVVSVITSLRLVETIRIKLQNIRTFYVGLCKVKSHRIFLLKLIWHKQRKV